VKNTGPHEEDATVGVVVIVVVGVWDIAVIVGGRDDKVAVGM
jgi:uncharacterized membrane protein